MSATLRIAVRDRRAQLVTVVLSVGIVVSALWLVPARAAITGAQSSGALQLTQTGARSALFSVRAMTPGEEVHGEVTLGNDGLLPGGLKLTLGELVEEDGVGARPLSEVLVVTVTEATGDARRTLYEGGLDRLGTVDLGSLTPIAKRVFRIAVAWPDAGAPASRTEGDNAYQGARTRFSLIWGFEEQRGQQPFAPGDAGGGGPVGGPAGGVGAAASPGAAADRGRTAASASRSCVSRRRFTIRVRSSRARRPTSAVVLVGTKRVKVLKGKRLTATVDLRGLAPQTVTVRIRGRTSRNRPYTEVRRYRTCVPKPKRK